MDISVFCTCCWIFWIFAIKVSDGLQCYSCSRVRDESGQHANLQCLATSSKITCDREQDRCYSLTGGKISDEVEKGCTRSQDCVGSRICCTSNFCNAGMGIYSQTGYGEPCAEIADCVQGLDDMACQQTTGSETRVCQCTDTRYQVGAMCRRRSYPGEPCTSTFHCMDNNSTCYRGRCQCHTGMFSNETFCQPKRALQEPCTNHIQCLGVGTHCTKNICSCRSGFKLLNGTDICSGAVRLFTLSYPLGYLKTLIATIWTVCLLNTLIF